MTEFDTEQDSGVTYLTREVAAADYIVRYRGPVRFLECCKVCPSFGRTYKCPPITGERNIDFSPFTTARIIVAKIPIPPRTPVSEASSILNPIRLKLEKNLLDMERQTAGSRAFCCTATDGCDFCSGTACARLSEEPCRHPELVRPSLEAYGFDLSATLSDLFCLEMLWGKDGYLPSYLVLIGAVFQ